jgi:hypothetical protein
MMHDIIQDPKRASAICQIISGVDDFGTGHSSLSYQSSERDSSDMRLIAPACKTANPASL